ncbi:16S rRNA (adenine(1518)-N(6)/adenine(1519)-N(6))-dimethyltransferase [Bifidobacterium aemilianum]|uniref:Ribosomal RNA small subunit methyltransferase A n=1 Tax=Bifidobacterium aemilianum TaxID=2493120 RepID=A0A366K7H9_9BIFI|nr:16S rRNA (adenine(1518)-N(6)/adenine(1519)-N(6))-dimethyltransferase RsmA [Bifidobacterium aemilianum]RBP97267.1 16S rRNA (adenine(1518)-N(6)/adenine(1519)-N(6))-dimethyltransferase [Bifidobacterium aemilianum]
MTTSSVDRFGANDDPTGDPARGQLLGAADIRRIAGEAGISPSKKFGQNFVIDPGTVRRIARLAQLDRGSLVLEVGPGLGSLTLALLETGARVWAVEIDPPLAQRLPETVAEFMPGAADRLTVVNQDALSLKPSDLNLPQAADGNPPSLTLVANLPYNVATPILLTLLERFQYVDRFVVMVQKEVADRLAAQAGSKIYGTPSLKLAWYGKAERVGLVGRHVFWPAPNVDSALVAFSRYESLPGERPHWLDGTGDGAGQDGPGNAAGARATGPATQTQDSLRLTTFSLIDAAFSQRRKTLGAALKKQVPSQVFSQVGIDPSRRGETLTIQEFVALAQALQAEIHQGRS